jgi:hypothetical protein
VPRRLPGLANPGKRPKLSKGAAAPDAGLSRAFDAQMNVTLGNEVAMKRISLGLAFLAATLLWGMGGAAAFTVENYGNGGNAQNFVDPDESAPIQRLTDPKSGASGTSTNVFGGHMNFSVTGSGANSGGGNSDGSAAYGSHNYFDPSQTPVSPSTGFSSGPFGMFGPRP